jgi:hypothetical protein
MNALRKGRVTVTPRERRGEWRITGEGTIAASSSA